MAKIKQLQKVINHPKAVYFGFERDREAARLQLRRAEGSEFLQVPAILAKQNEEGRAAEAELEALQGAALVESSGKLSVLDRVLVRCAATGSRALVFSQYTLTLDVLSEYCEWRFGAEGTGYLRLDGGTHRVKREMDVRSFNSADSPIPVYLIGTKAGGMGINLATADVVVLYDTSWNPQIDLQAQDRAHRIGQKRKVKVFRLIAEGTMEEQVLARARQKLVLDAMLIKKRAEANELAASMGDEHSGNQASSGEPISGELEEETAVSKLSLDELWLFLAHGAEQVADPTAEAGGAVLCANDYDKIITSNFPAGEDDSDAFTNPTYSGATSLKVVVDDETDCGITGIFDGVGVGGRGVMSPSPATMSPRSPGPVSPSSHDSRWESPAVLAGYVSVKTESPLVKAKSKSAIAPTVIVAPIDSQVAKTTTVTSKEQKSNAAAWSTRFGPRANDPENWIKKKHSILGSTYYWNKVTRAVSWTRPEASITTAAPSVPTPKAAPAPVPPRAVCKSNILTTTETKMANAEQPPSLLHIPYWAASEPTGETGTDIVAVNAEQRLMSKIPFRVASGLTVSMDVETTGIHAEQAPSILHIPYWAAVAHHDPYRTNGGSSGEDGGFSTNMVDVSSSDDSDWSYSSDEELDDSYKHKVKAKTQVTTFGKSNPTITATPEGRKAVAPTAIAGQDSSDDSSDMSDSSDDNEHVVANAEATKTSAASTPLGSGKSQRNKFSVRAVTTSSAATSSTTVDTATGQIKSNSEEKEFVNWLNTTSHYALK